MISKHYTDVQSVQQYLCGYGLDIHATDARVEALLGIADSVIDSETQRDFHHHVDVVEFHHGTGKDYIQSYHFPITQITHLVMYNQLMQAMRTFLDTELIVYPERGQIYLPPIYPAFMSDKPFMAMFGNLFIPGRYNIELQYNYGFTEVPAEIKTVASRIVIRELMFGYWAKLSRGGQSLSFDGASFSYGAKPFAGILETWDQENKSILARWKRVYFRAV
jgi:hypothetical protein